MRFLARIHYGCHFPLGCKALDVQSLTFANRLRNFWGGQGTLRQHLARAAADKDSNAIHFCRKVAAFSVPRAARTTQGFSRCAAWPKGNLPHGA
jgi:hypothetical protein